MNNIKEILLNSDNPIISEFSDEILAIYNKFINSPYYKESKYLLVSTLNETIKNICLNSSQSLDSFFVLTGEDDEWIDAGGGLLQNRKNSAVYKDLLTNKAYFINAILWRCDGSLFTGVAYTDLNLSKSVGSLQYIKSFPFKPKIFIIDVARLEYIPDLNSTSDNILKYYYKDLYYYYVIKNPNQLKEVYKYYEQSF